MQHLNGQASQRISALLLNIRPPCVKDSDDLLAMRWNQEI